MDDNHYKVDSTKSFSDNNFDLWVLMDRTRSTINRSCELELAVYDMTPEQAGILDTLVRLGGSASVAEIAETTMRQFNSVTTLVNRMVLSGLIEKHRSSNGKKYIISITSKGMTTHKNITSKAIEIAFSCLSTEERHAMFLSLRKLMDMGRKMLGMDFKLPFLPYGK